MDNAPVYGCDSCRTTGGRMSCFKHGWRVIKFDGVISEQPKRDDWGHAVCPKHGEFTCPECMEDIAQEASSIMYNSIFSHPKKEEVGG